MPNNSKYITNYIKNNVRRFEIKLSKKTEKEIIIWLENKENINEYIKSLIIKDKKESTD